MLVVSVFQVGGKFGLAGLCHFVRDTFFRSIDCM